MTLVARRRAAYPARMASDRRWTRALADHREAAEAFAARVALVGAARWPVPRAPGKWSAAEESLHVRQVYDVLLATLAGGPGLRSRVPEWRATLYRRLFFPVFRRLGRLPRGIRAPREVKPASDEAVQATPAERAAELRAGARAFEAVLLAARDAGRPVALRHPYFGRLDALTALRFVALHTRHHLRNLP